tara:strand:- start:666 stop:1313 length:648 start_codon:yes stop_codon:yes gene_type:complete
LRYKNIIFDFDGVLAESLQIKTNAFYKLYEKFDREIAQKVVDHHEANGGMSRYDKFPYYHKKFLNKDISESEISQLSDNFSKIVVDAVINVEEVKGAHWFLEKYYKKCNYWIVSATPTVEMIEIARKRGIADFFIKIYGSPSDKKEVAKKILKENNLAINETVFLGDAKSDFDAAKSNNIDFILRSTNENKNLFRNKNMVRFKDYHELNKILDNQ